MRTVASSGHLRLSPWFVLVGLIIMPLGAGARRGLAQGNVPRLAPVTDPGRRTTEGLVFANALLKERRYDLAVEEFERVLKQNPNPAQVAEAKFGLGRARLFLNQYKLARPQFEDFLKLAPQHPNAPTALFRVGETAYLSGDLAAARQALEEYTTKYPNHVHLDTAWPYLGDVYFGQGDLAQARRAYEQALGIDPKGRLADRTRFLLGRTLAAQGEPEEAIKIFTLLSNQNNSSEWAEKSLFQLGQVYLDVGKFREADDAFLTFEQQFSKSTLVPEARLRRAESLLRLERVRDAEGILGVLALEAPRAVAVQAANDLGMSQWDRGRFDDAKVTWDKTLRRFPNTPVLQFRLAEALVKDGRTDDARTRLLALSEQNPKDPWAPVALVRAARVALDAKDPRTARALANQFSSKFPGNALRADARLIEGQALLGEGQTKEAINVLNRILTEDKPGPETTQAARYYLGVAYRTDGQDDKATSILSDLTKGSSSVAVSDALFVLGQGHFEANRFAEAISVLEKYLAGKPKGEVAAQSLAYLVVARHKQGQPGASQDALDQLARDWSKSKALGWVRLTLGEAALSEKQYERAIGLFKPVAESDAVEYRSRGLSGLGWGYFQTGRLADAAETFGRIVESAPTDPLAAEAALMRGHALEKADKREEALNAYRVVVEKYGQSEQAPLAMLGEARTLARADRHDEAARVFERFFQTYPKGPPGGERLDLLLGEWAWSLLDAGKVKAAEQVFQRLQSEFPESTRTSEIRFDLGETAYQAKDYENAARWLEPLTAAESKASDELKQSALFLMGRVYVERSNWANATQAFDRLITQFPEGKENLEAKLWKAEALFRGGDFKSAEPEFAAIGNLANPESKPWIATAQLRHLQCLLNLERWRDAVRKADSIKSQSPAFPQIAEVDYARGRALQMMAQFDEARESYQASIEAAPGSEQAAKAQFMRGETYFHQSNYVEALREFQKVELLYKAPEWQAAALLEVGKVFERQGKWRNAVTSYEKLLTKFPNDKHSPEAARLLETARKRVEG